MLHDDQRGGMVVGREAQEGRDVCTADSRCCTAEINTTL